MSTTDEHKPPYNIEERFLLAAIPGSVSERYSVCLRGQGNSIGQVIKSASEPGWFAVDSGGQRLFQRLEATRWEAAALLLPEADRSALARYDAEADAFTQNVALARSLALASLETARLAVLNYARLTGEALHRNDGRCERAATHNAHAATTAVLHAADKIRGTA